MKAILILLTFVISGLLGGLYYQFLYPPSVMKREIEKMLGQVSAAVETQDRAKVAEALGVVIADDALIHLSVETSLGLQPTGQRPVSQDFDKASFIAFIDNLLYSVNNVHFYPKLDDLAYRADEPVLVHLSSRVLAVGPAYYAGTQITMRFTAETACDGMVAVGNPPPQVKQMICQVGLRITPADGSQAIFDNKTVKEMIDRDQR